MADLLHWLLSKLYFPFLFFLLYQPFCVWEQEASQVPLGTLNAPAGCWLFPSHLPCLPEVFCLSLGIAGSWQDMEVVFVSKMQCEKFGYKVFLV